MEIVCRQATEGFTYAKKYESTLTKAGNFCINNDNGYERMFSPDVVTKYFRLGTEYVKEVNREPTGVQIPKAETGQNNGKENNFYSIPSWVKDCDTLAEYLRLDPYEFNILKTLWLNLGLRHDGTNVERELNKREHYAKQCVIKHKRKR